jgi:hypothetical protein
MSSHLAPELTTMAKKKSDQPQMKKLPAVREAVKTLGVEASLGEVRKWVKDKYNLDMTDATLQNYVSAARKEVREQTGKPPARTPRKQAMPAAARTSSSSPALRVDQVVEAITVLKGLMQKLGKDNVAKLLEAL